MPPNPGGNTSKRRPSRPLRVPATISFGKDSWSISDTYSYGGSSAILFGWRDTTVDVETWVT